MHELLIESRGQRVHRRRIEELLNQTSGPVRIVSPYITETDLLPKLTGRGVQLLTSTMPADLAEGASSLVALERILKSPIQCSHYSQAFLHAKIYIFGDEYAIVTSANFTKNAFGKNLEVGVLLDESGAVELREWFDEIWETASPLLLEDLNDLREQIQEKADELKRAKANSPVLPGWNLPDPPTAQPTGTVVTLPAASEMLVAPSPDLLPLLESARQVWRCNTNRNAEKLPGSKHEAEDLMRSKSVAALWISSVEYRGMYDVRKGDIIVFFSNGQAGGKKE